MAASPSLTADAQVREQLALCVCPVELRRLRRVGYLRGAPPVGLDCNSPVHLVCDRCQGSRVLPCGTFRATRCLPCSHRSRRRLTRIAEHRRPTPEHAHGYFLTLTAPSFTDHRHFVPGRRGDHGTCPPGCRSGVGDLASWNSEASGRWNWLRTLLGRAFDLEFFRVVEVQRRGALHLHVVLFSDRELDPAELWALALRAGFGCAGFDLSPIRTGRDARHAEYVTKAVAGYATKASDQRPSVPWYRVVDQVLNVHTGELEDLVSSQATYRIWSASRGWGLTMREVRDAIRQAVQSSKAARAVDAVAPATALPPAECCNPPP